VDRSIALTKFRLLGQVVLAETQPDPAHPQSAADQAAERLEEHLDGIHHDSEVGVNRMLIRLFFLSCTSAAMSELRRGCRGRSVCGR
jgi:hypothetical protein